MTEKNLNTYSETEVVDAYCKMTNLQRPEENILKKLKPELLSMKMLDIGVGEGGRFHISQI